VREEEVVGQGRAGSSCGKAKDHKPVQAEIFVGDLKLSQGVVAEN
jgi:hypothetical protein